MRGRPSSNPGVVAGSSWPSALRCVLALVAGLALGEGALHVWQPSAEAPERDVPRIPVGRVAEVAWPAARTAAVPAGPPAPSRPEEPIEPLDAWVPRLQPALPLVGAAEDGSAADAEWVIRKGALPLPVALQSPHERAFRASLHAEHLATLHRTLAGDGAAPAAAWGDARFQVAGTLAGPHDVLAVGRDFLPRASPASSLVWFEQVHGASLPDPDRAEAMRVLHDFEATRKANLARLANRAFALAATGKFERSGAAFAIVDGRLVVVPAAATPEIERLIETLRRADERARSELDAAIGAPSVDRR